ncbi:MAG: C-GCAxxG-C-C family protein, partial [Clostridiales bacterium]|nr:C-GCAxxG-C-C family protein [Clostridiales bacterium]
TIMEKNWDEIKDLAGKYASENLLGGMNCAESVYEACIRSGALDAPLDTVAYATGFGGGGGCAGFTCGALAGAILANGAVHGRKDPGSIPSEIRRPMLRERIYKRYNNIVSAFLKENGPGLCREFSEMYEGYSDDAFRENCVRMCGSAARIAVTYIMMDADEAAALEYDMSAIGILGWKPE